MPAVSFHMLAQISMERLLNCLAEGMVIAVFAWVLLRLAGRKNSGTRFVVWFCALVAIAVSPFVWFGSAAGVSRNSSAALTIPDSWSVYLFAAWAVVAAIGLARVALGLWHLHSVWRDCTPVGASALDPMVVATLEEFRAGRPVELLTSEQLRVPTAIGLSGPAVIVPRWTLRELSPDELNAVLLHELAHLRRWDDWTNLVQKVLRAVFFFHPAVWWVESRLSLEREMACDDIVLAHTSNPRAYAECLVSLAEKNLLQSGLAFAQAAVGRMRQTSLRVLQILDVRRPTSVKVWRPAPWVVAGFSAVCLASAAHAPKLVAFGEPAANTVASIPSVRLASSEPTYVPPIVPAKFVALGKSNLVQAKTRSSKSSAKLGQRVIVSAVCKAKGSTAEKPANSTVPVLPILKPRTPGAARVVRTSFAESSPVVVMQETVYVLVQNPALGGARLVWRLSVWQLQFSPVPPARTAPEVPSKSI